MKDGLTQRPWRRALKNASAKKAAAKLISAAISLTILWFLYRKLDFGAILEVLSTSTAVAADFCRDDHSNHLGQRIAFSMGVYSRWQSVLLRRPRDDGHFDRNESVFAREVG